MVHTCKAPKAKTSTESQPSRKLNSHLTFEFIHRVVKNGVVAAESLVVELIKHNEVAWLNFLLQTACQSGHQHVSATSSSQCVQIRTIVDLSRSKSVLTAMTSQQNAINASNRTTEKSVRWLHMRNVVY